MKYIIHKLKNFNYKEFYKYTKEISKINNKSILYCLFDIIKCGFLMGSGYKNYYDYEFYSLTDNERKTYVTDRNIIKINELYNDKEKLIIFKDKSLFNSTYNKFIKRDFIDLRNVSFKEFKEFVKDKSKIVVKSISQDNDKYEILNIDKEKFKNEYNVLKIYNSIIKNEEYLIEEYVVNNEKLLYNDSYIKVVTFLDEKGKCHILESIFVINDVKEKMYSFINEEGKLYTPAISLNGKLYTKHPSNNSVIVGYKVPLYDKVQEFLDKVSKVVKNVRFLEWNILISKDELVLLSASFIPKVYQPKPSVSGTKTGKLDKYKKYMGEKI